MVELAKTKFVCSFYTHQWQHDLRIALCSWRQSRAGTEMKRQTACSCCVSKKSQHEPCYSLCLFDVFLLSQSLCTYIREYVWLAVLVLENAGRLVYRSRGLHQNEQKHLEKLLLKECWNNQRKISSAKRLLTGISTAFTFEH